VIKYAIIMLAVAGAVSGQSKVGTTASSFLALPPSVTAAGMGDVGVTLTSDRSYFYNPGSLGLLDCQRIQVSGSPLPTEYPGDVHYRSYSAAGKLLNGKSDSRWSLAAAYHYYRLRSPEIEETTYEYPDGTGRTYHFTANNHEITVGAAYDAEFSSVSEERSISSPRGSVTNPESMERLSITVL